MASILSCTRIEWGWRVSVDRWTNEEKWQLFNDVESQLIERAFQEDSSEILLDDCLVDFRCFSRIPNDDRSQRQPLERMSRVDLISTPKLRETRFLSTPINTEVPFAATEDLVEFIKEIRIFYHLLGDRNLQNDQNRCYMVERAAEGILIEGKLAGREKEAVWIAEKLLQIKNRSREDVWKSCAYLHTMESFLYNQINEQLCLNGGIHHQQTLKSKIETFGPFSYLLCVLSPKTNYEIVTVYRPAQLSDEIIDQYRENLGARINFPGFTSTSRGRSKAEKIGNSVFILNIMTSNASDMSSCSDHSDEEEVLLHPNFSLFIHSCKFDRDIRKWIIILSYKKYVKPLFEFSP